MNKWKVCEEFQCREVHQATLANQIRVHQMFGLAGRVIAKKLREGRIY